MRKIPILPMALLSACLTGHAFGAIVSRDILKTFFETGDKPTEAQFSALIDSYLHAGLDYGDAPNDHTLGIHDGQIALDPLGEVRVFTEGGRVDDLLPFSGTREFVHVNPLADSRQRYVAVRFNDGGAIHFGFLQLQIEPPTSSDPYAIHLHHFAYETDPGTPITTFFQPIPEPAAVVLLATGALLVVFARRHTRIPVP